LSEEESSEEHSDDMETIVKRFATVLDIGKAKAKMLYNAGFNTPERLLKAEKEDLVAIKGISSSTAAKVLENRNKLLSEKENKKEVEADEEDTPSLKENKADKELLNWLSGEEDTAEWLEAADETPPASKPEILEDEESVDILKKWLRGEEDDLEAWLEEEPVGGGMDVVGSQLAEREKMLADREKELEKKEKEIEELRTVLKEKTAEIESGDFDPMKAIEENAELKRQLQEEILRRKSLEEEIDHIKKGSVAVIKYMKTQQLRAGKDAGEIGAQEVLAGMEAKIKSQEETIAELKAELEKKIEELPPDAKELEKKRLELLEKEAKLREQEERMKSLENISASESSAELENKLAAELRQKEEDFLSRENELKKQILELQKEIEEYKIELKQMKEANELAGSDKGEIDKELARRLKEIQIKEKAITLREEEIKQLKAELKIKDDEIKKLKEAVDYKDQELLRREEDLLYREKLLMEEKRRFEEAAKEGGSLEEMELKKKLEHLQEQINQKEEEIKAREKYLNAKMEELRLREQGIIEDEIEAREEERAAELNIQKAKTGIMRLDDLLMGGIPFGSNVLIYGPPFTGKEVVVNRFIAEGLKKGVPAIWVLTDKAPADIREEMLYVLSGYEEYEKLGLVKYVDAYSKSMGVTEEEEGVIYLEQPSDHEGIMREVDKISAELLQEHKYYRLAFRSVSTLIAYLDTNTAFRFLNPFAGKRKRQHVVSMYLIEKGMHTEQEIQMLGSMMDGMIDFKVEQLSTFLSVKGICDVQSRAWIKYTFTKQGLTIGSFSLDKIK